jgi:predicted phosphodiesterase
VRDLIISDIHANFDALEAVLQDAAGRYDRIICLGDIVGYGPDPNRVVDWVRANVASVVRGNHDKAATGLEDPSWFNPVAEYAARWTQKELTPENDHFVRVMQRGPVPVNSYQIAHGSPLDEDGYIVTTVDAGFAFPYIDSEVTFFGHTHLQGGFSWSRMKAHPIPRPCILDRPEVIELQHDEAYLLNPGSVGQPRDGDPRAAYLIYDSAERTVAFARVAYDIEAVQQKIRRAQLPDILADRLSVGR